MWRRSPPKVTTLAKILLASDYSWVQAAPRGKIIWSQEKKKRYTKTNTIQQNLEKMQKRLS